MNLHVNIFKKFVFITLFNIDFIVNYHISDNMNTLEHT